MNQYIKSICKAYETHIKRSMNRSRIIRVPFFLALLVSGSLHSQVTEYQGQTASGAYYLIAIPEGWTDADNLVIWNHGYQGYTSSEPKANPSLGPLEDFVLDQGYAMAASSFSQTGWAVFNSHIDNKELYEKFLELAEEPEKVFIQGASMGGIVSVRDLEAKLIPNVDGALLMCGAVAGAENWIEAFDLRMIYEAVCSDVNNGELPTDSWTEQPLPLLGEIQFFESLQQCTGLVADSYIDGLLGKLLETPEQLQRLNQILELTNTHKDFLLLNLGYAVFEIPSLINDSTKLNGSNPFGNVSVDYGDEQINKIVQRVVALPSANQQFLNNYTPSGDIGNTRIVSIHTSKDGLVRPANQQALIKLLPADQLTTAIVVEEEPSHCSFTDGEGFAAWLELVSWVDGENQPTVTSLQSTCNEIDEDSGQCRFDPQFQLADQLLTYPRIDSVSPAGVNSYDAITGILAIESLVVSGDTSAYSLDLLPPADESVLFTIADVEKIEPFALWQHQSTFVSEDLLLYLPQVEIAPYTPGDTVYDVFMRYISDGKQTGLELIEYQSAP